METGVSLGGDKDKKRMALDPIGIKRLRRFNDEFKDVSLKDFFGIIHFLFDFGFQFEIKGEGKMLLHVKISKKYRVVEFAGLPLDLCREIAEYNIDTINLHFQMKLTPHYPFSAPFWSFESFEHNFLRGNKVERANRFFTKLVKKHNERNDGWSSAFHIEKDILLLLGDVLHRKFRVFSGNFVGLPTMC